MLTPFLGTYDFTWQGAQLHSALLGVSMELEGDVLVVTFDSGEEAERWRPAPDGYPLDGSRELIQFQGRYFVPMVPVEGTP